MERMIVCICVAIAFLTHASDLDLREVTKHWSVTGSVEFEVCKTTICVKTLPFWLTFDSYVSNHSLGTHRYMSIQSNANA